MKVTIPSNYRIIPSFPDYCVEEFGSNVIKIYSDGSTKVLGENANGSVTLFANGNRYCRSKYQLANEAFGRTSGLRGRGRSKVKVQALHVENGSTKLIDFDSMTEASNFTGVPVCQISRIISKKHRQTANGWSFYGKED